MNPAQFESAVQGQPWQAVLKRKSLAMAAAALLGAAAAPAWAVDICTTPATTISVNTALPDGDECYLNAGESLGINAGVSISGRWGVAQGTYGETAGGINNAGAVTGTEGGTFMVSGTLSGGLVNQAGATIDGVEGIAVWPEGRIENGIVNDGTITFHGSPVYRLSRIYLYSYTFEPPFRSPAITGGITNRGFINAPSGGYAIEVPGTEEAHGTIDWVANLQGVGSPGVLTYSGWLPGEYRAIVNSLSRFGQMQVYNVAGSMAFAVDPSSTLAAGTYQDVLQGVPAANLTGPFSGTHGGMTWRLLQSAPDSGVWDLVVEGGSPPPQVTAVPTLGEWSLMVLGLLAAGLGARRLRRGG